jgi:plastocyanin
MLTALAACGEESADSQSSGQSGYAVVNMIDNTFSPQVIRVPVGGRIKFKNGGQNPHNAVSSDGGWSTEVPFGNIEMPAGASTSINFNKAGAYPYICTFHATEDGRGMVGTVVVGDAEYVPKDRKAGRLTPVAEASGIVRSVPADYPTIQSAVDAADPGDMVMIGNGIYAEEVTVTTPSLILRGEDRNKVIIDGEFQRPNGIKILEADGVVVENLTVRNAKLNGIFWTGVEGYRASWITAYNNKDYGIYAFDSQDGVIEHSYASGSPDSGIYIGQCQPCRAVIDDVVSENNALGYSGTNSGGDLYIVNSTWRNNMSGLVPNTLDSELLPPQRGTTIAGNLIVNNNNLKAPAHPLEYPTFGEGVLIIGGHNNLVQNNLIVGHPNHGVMIAAIIDENLWTATGNVIKGNTIARSGRADIALGGPAATGNCFADNNYRTTIPPGLEYLQSCQGPRLPMGQDLSALWGTLAMFSEVVAGTYPHNKVEDQPIPPPQPTMPNALSKKAQPAYKVFESRKPDLKMISTPALDKLVQN